MSAWIVIALRSSQNFKDLFVSVSNMYHDSNWLCDI